MHLTTFERLMLWVSDWSGIPYETKAAKEEKRRLLSSTFEQQQASYDRDGLDDNQRRIAEFMAAVERNDGTATMSGSLSTVSRDRELASQNNQVTDRSRETSMLQRDLSNTLNIAAIVDSRGGHSHAAQKRAEAQVIESKLRGLGA